jgi:diguanylate cyclase (GGDEF)-like protein
MNLRLRFLLLMTAIFCSFVLLTWVVSQQLINRVNEHWGSQLLNRQVLFDKYRTLSPLINEIALARKMAVDPAIVRMAQNESDPAVRQQGIAAMEIYRLSFRDHSYFAAMAHSGDYYFNDAANQFAGRQLRYVLSPTNANDKWFYATMSSDKDYQINLDPDVHLGVTKVWINVLIRHGGQVLGVIGTGLDLGNFLKETVSSTPPGVHNLFIDKNMAIQLHNDPMLIDYMSIAKDVNQRVKVDRLLTNPDDVEHLRQAMQRLEANPSLQQTMWVDFSGMRYLLGVAYLPEIGWYDLTLMNPLGLMPEEGIYTALIAFGSTFLLALLIVGQALRIWVLRPISILQRSTDQILHNNFDINMPEVGGGEVGRLARSFANMAQYVHQTNQELERKVQERTDSLQRLTETDPLTGLLNRRGMTERLETEIARQARQGGTIGLLLLDLDHFKEVNDHYGHASGDLALGQAAHVIQTTKRAYDHAGRWGGEEFIILAPDCNEADLLAFAERIRLNLSLLQIGAGSNRFSFTASIGVHLAATPQTLDTMLQHVDEALYAAKKAGRNCVRQSNASKN